MKRILTILMTLVMLLAVAPFALAQSEAGSADAQKTEAQGDNQINPKKIIFAHLGDTYGWELPFTHDVRLPLPIIVRGNDGSWRCFSSARLMNGAEYEGFKIASADDANYPSKVVEMINGTEYRPLDLSITKDVLALIISALVVLACVFSLVRWYRRNPMKAPRKGVGIIEVITQFVYDGVIVCTLGDKAKKFGPYLLTVFFLILFMNLLGLCVIFPAGANLTGNIAITMFLAVCTFLLTNLFGTKHYWKDIFWPDVPLWLKFPIPIMPFIELFGIFTKPFALCVRLFANMMGGHMIVLVLTLLIFIFQATMNSMVVTGATTIVSVAFSLFMLLIDTLISFIQAYVFTMLSTLFISLAQEKGEKEQVIESK
jgi:F-type H+-transporting ATPase subunit a